jgi:hypothetical protein
MSGDLNSGGRIPQRAARKFVASEEARIGAKLHHRAGCNSPPGVAHDL